MPQAANTPAKILEKGILRKLMRTLKPVTPLHTVLSSQRGSIDWKVCGAAYCTVNAMVVVCVMAVMPLLDCAITFNV